MIDLRSDTVTRPTDEMRDAIAGAAVGDDVYGEDPSVNALEEKAASRLGKEAAVYVPSGTQANLIALLSHCDRGDEYIVGRSYHTFAHEGGGAAALGGIQPAPLSVAADGTIPLDELRGAIKPDDDPRSARSSLICLENPTHGRVVPTRYIRDVADIADEHGLSLHLDGARIFNAAVATQQTPSAIAAPADTVMFDLSKGLGAPVGGILCGPESSIAGARRWRKVVGGGWRQAGVIAAAGTYALNHHVDRLAEDHDKATRLANRLADLPGLSVDRDAVETNMVFAELERGDADALADHLEERDIAIHPIEPLRLVTHLDVSVDDVDRAAAAIGSYLEAAQGR